MNIEDQIGKLEIEKSVLVNEASNLNKLVETLKDSNNGLHHTKDELTIQLTAATSKVAELNERHKELSIINNNDMHKIGTLEDSVRRRDESIHALQGASRPHNILAYSLTHSLTHSLTDSGNEKSFQAEIASLQAQLISINEEKNNLNTENLSNINNLNYLTSEYDHVRELLEGKQTELAELKDKVSKMIQSYESEFSNELGKKDILIQSIQDKHKVLTHKLLVDLQKEKREKVSLQGTLLHIYSALFILTHSLTHSFVYREIR